MNPLLNLTITLQDWEYILRILKHQFKTIWKLGDAVEHLIHLFYFYVFLSSSKIFGELPLKQLVKMLKSRQLPTSFVYLTWNIWALWHISRWKAACRWKDWRKCGTRGGGGGRRLRVKSSQIWTSLSTGNLRYNGLSSCEQNLEIRYIGNIVPPHPPKHTHFLKKDNTQLSFPSIQWQSKVMDN